jgi:hypothetical protein
VDQQETREVATSALRSEASADARSIGGSFRGGVRHTKGEKGRKAMVTKSTVTLCVVTLCVLLLCSFGSAVAQIVWVQYPDNPVFIPPSGSESSGRAIVWDGSMYHMIFEYGDELGLGHATSPDGVEWTLDSASPVLVPGPEGAWDSEWLSPGAMTYDDGVFDLWYSGCHREFPAVPCSVGYATSPDGSVWTKYPLNPVLGVGPSGSFDGYTLDPGSVVFAEGAYRMWYTAMDKPSGAVTIGYADSPDKTSWTRHPNPVLEPGPGWDQWDVGNPTVVYDGSGYQMWYSGSEDGIVGSIGYARSTNGIEWVEHHDNPVVSNVLGASNPAVVFDGSTYHMWYLVGGGTWNFAPDVIYYATSDCVTGVTGRGCYWQVIPAAALAWGAEGSFYRTDVDLNNSGDRPVEYELLWLPRGHANTDPMRSETFTLGPGRSARYTNLLAEVFGMGTDSLGAVLIRASRPGLLATSRTCNIATGKGAGTFGQDMPAVSINDFIQPNERRRILFASENEDLRFNVGCQSGSDRPILVHLDLFDDEGSLLDHVRMVLPAWGNNQLNRVFADFMPVNGYVDVWSDTAGALFTCYGSVVDNLSNDPMTVLPQ